MPSIVIRLDPAKLDDADLDMRYEIPDLLGERSGGSVEDEGYDYEQDGNALLLFLSTADLTKAVPLVVQLLERERLHGNDLSKAAQVGVSEEPPGTATEFRVVYPPGAEGVIRATA